MQDFTGAEWADTELGVEVEGAIKGTLYYERTYSYSAATFAAKSVDELMNKTLPGKKKK